MLWGSHAIFYELKTHSSLHRELQDILVEELDVYPGLTVLDIGIGTAAFEWAIVRKKIPAKDIRIIGVDNSRMMLNLADRNLVKHGFNFSLQKHDLNTPLPMREGTFDRIVCSNTLYAVKNAQLLVQELYRVMKKDGMIVITNPTENFSFLPIFFYQFKKANSFKDYVMATMRILLFIFFMLPFELVISFLTASKSYANQSENQLRELFEHSGWKEVYLQKGFAGQNYILRARK